MATVEAYRSWQPKQGIRLNLNEAPQELPDDFKEEVLMRLKGLAWRRYPDLEMTRCRRLIAAWHGVDEDGVLLGNGSNELLAAAMLAFSKVGGHIVWPSPGFSMVSQWASLFDRCLCKVPLCPKTFSFPALASQSVLSGADMVLLTSPNNPTGTCLPPQIFTDLMAQYSGSVVVDEAYGEFAKNSFIAYLKQYPNLLILRTFSKAMHLAGARIGYALAAPGLIRRLNACKAPFSLGVFQQACVETALNRLEYFEDTMVLIRQERCRLSEALSRLAGFGVIESQANFILFSPGPGRAAELNQYLIAHGLWLRAFTEPELADWLRVSLGTVQENEAFLQAVAAFAMERES